MVQTIKPTDKKHNPKSLQKQHGYKTQYILNNINNIYKEYTKFISYELETQHTLKPQCIKPIATINIQKYKQR